METLSVYILFIVGVIMIIKGGDLFIESAIWIAQKTGMPTFLIGATVVSLATTMPELFVSTIASAQGNYDVAISNAVGSVICNTGLILAISIISSPTKIYNRSFTFKGIYLLFSTIALILFSSNGLISKSEGLILIIFFILFMLMNAIESKLIVVQEKIETNNLKINSTFKNISLFIVGALLVIIGSRLLVSNGMIIALILGVPQQIISLTLIALGTSLPELITTISALIKKESGLSLGNILGANILNYLFVIGSSVIISPNGLVISNQTYSIDIPTSLLLIVLLVASGILKGGLGRRLGLTLLTIYFTYLIYITLMI